MKNILYILFILVLFGCKSTSNPTGPKLGEEFEFKYGQTVQIQDQNLTIEFTSVIEDSRCPEGAICIWEGNAKITIQVNAKEHTLNTTLEPKEIEDSEFRIKLLSVSPYPKLNEEIKLVDYRIKLVIVK